MRHYVGKVMLSSKGDTVLFQIPLSQRASLDDDETASLTIHEGVGDHLYDYLKILE